MPGVPVFLHRAARSGFERVRRRGLRSRGPLVAAALVVTGETVPARRLALLADGAARPRRRADADRRAAPRRRRPRRDLDRVRVRDPAASSGCCRRSSPTPPRRRSPTSTRGWRAEGRLQRGAVRAVAGRRGARARRCSATSRPIDGRSAARCAPSSPARPRSSSSTSARRRRRGAVRRRAARPLPVQRPPVPGADRGLRARAVADRRRVGGGEHGARAARAAAGAGLYVGARQRRAATPTGPSTTR